MRKILFLILSFVVTATLSAQTHSSADRLFQEADYANAQKEYGALLKSYPKHALYLYRYARCAQELGDFPTALRYFELSGERYDLKYFYLGYIYMKLWHFDEAIRAYETYLSKPNLSEERVKYAQELIRYAEKFQRYMRRVERIQIIDSIEVPFDSILQVCLLSPEAGTLSFDENKHIVYTNQRGDRKLWTTLVDSNQHILSNHRLLDDWTTPDTLPKSINFTQQQSSPFMLNDGVTLYFAADDPNGLGGLDIYVSRYNISTENYTAPENLGMPYNSPANEYLFLIDETRNTGYLATDRFAAEGRVTVYSFIIPEYKKYWKNISADSLIAYAQLKKIEWTTIDSTHIQLPLEPLDTNDVIGSFHFVINDSTIYHSLHDFRNTHAREKYLEWTRIERQLQSESTKLSQLREQYITADETLQKELAPIILQLENNQSHILVLCEKLLLKIREIENLSNQE